MIEINLDNLINNYEKDLLTKLRGFTNEHKYIEYWVPGTSKIDSLFNLVNSLFESKEFRFNIVINKKDDEVVNYIMDFNNKIGQLKKTKSKDHFLISFDLDKNKFDDFFKKKISSSIYKTKKIFNKTKVVNKPIEKELINEDFKESIKNLDLKKFKNNIKKDVVNCIQYTKEILGNKIHIFIDKSDHLVKYAFHDFEKVTHEALVVDIFLEKIINKSIQECADHSVIYLEHDLRPKIVEEKVKGIILPHVGGKIFQILNDLIRQTYAQCKFDLNFSDKINKEFTQLSSRWSLLDLSKKENLINEVLKNHVLKELNLGENDIVLSRIEIGFRIILELSNNFRNRQKEENMLLKVEKILHKKIDERLELFTMEIKDQNKLRIKNSPQKNL
ncbi:hypothetical protein OAO09_02240 [Candidatus Pelagibacter sp.]|nr:hypothetical protein [Candidatus Pelagibacter sp.]